jgi:hypothetical protein
MARPTEDRRAGSFDLIDRSAGIAGHHPLHPQSTSRSRPSSTIAPIRARSARPPPDARPAHRARPDPCPRARHRPGGAGPCVVLSRLGPIVAWPRTCGSRRPSPPAAPRSIPDRAAAGWPSRRRQTRVRRRRTWRSPSGRRSQLPLLDSSDASTRRPGRRCQEHGPDRLIGPGREDRCRLAMARRLISGVVETLGVGARHRRAAATGRSGSLEGIHRVESIRARLGILGGLVRIDSTIVSRHVRHG